MMEAFLAQNASTGNMFPRPVTMADCCLVPQVFNAIAYKCDSNPIPR